MGDRANVYVKDGDTGVYLYTHWSGYELPETVRTALARCEGRESDGPYLARIVFCEMVKGDEEGTTGYGISTRLCDNEHPIVVLDPMARTVAFSEEGNERSGPYIATMPMSEYAAKESADYPEALV